MHLVINRPGVFLTSRKTDVNVCTFFTLLASIHLAHWLDQVVLVVASLSA
jgi:hypothetical protein